MTYKPRQDYELRQAQARSLFYFRPRRSRGRRVVCWLALVLLLAGFAAVSYWIWTR